MKVWKELGLYLAMGFLLTTIVIFNMESYARAKLVATQENLADEVLRFHVIANSDSKEDQEIKLEVKEEVIAFMKQHLSTQASVTETKIWVENHLDQIEEIGIEVLEGYGKKESVVARLEEAHFPTKRYGDISFPEGEYEALRVEIGDAAGENWWCCLYPNLCFIDATYGVVSEEGKEQLQGVLDEDEYEMITEEDIKIEWFFF